MLAYNIFIVFFIYDVASLDFIVTDQRSDFKGAHKICSKRGLEIVRVDNIQDAHDILAEVRGKYHSIGNYWIDANDIKTEGTFVHYDGTLAAVNMWNPGQPTEDTTVNCVYGGYKLLFGDISCDDKLNVICSKVTKQEFFITNLLSDFEGAHKICSSLGTEIVRVDNIDTAKDINAEIKRKYPNDTGYWIDANDIKNENVWVHYDGTPAANNMWHPGEPNNGVLENCAIGSWGMFYADWADYLCSQKMRVICSKIPNQDFIITNKESNFKGAHKICSELGLEIVKVENMHIAIKIYAELQKQNGSYHWVDANDIKTAGLLFVTFVNQDATLAVTNMWNPREPNGSTRLNCAYGGYKLRWQNGSCDSIHTVICSIPKKMISR